MPVAIGVQHYAVGAPPVIAYGAGISDAELDVALQTSVAPLLRDDSGRIELEGLLSGLANTTFETQSLRRILESAPEPEGWRVGEALAEAFLVEHRQCSFPWPCGRDLKNPNASPAGTDLVGFQATTAVSDSYRFAFGEVKTSFDSAVPPSVVTGRHGLVRQVEALRDSNRTKDFLVRYLGAHASRQAWEPHFHSAAARYLRDTGDIALFGILIRNTQPAAGDLASRVSGLCTGCPAQTTIELRAIYLPEETINPPAPRATLATRAVAAL